MGLMNYQLYLKSYLKYQVRIDMGKINTKILNFLKKHPVCSLTTLLKDGLPHAAAVHYSHNENPMQLYSSTDKNSKKCEALLDGNTTKASVVIGFSEKEWITLQMDGEI